MVTERNFSNKTINVITKLTVYYKYKIYQQKILIHSSAKNARLQTVSDYVYFVKNIAKVEPALQKPKQSTHE